MAGAMAEAAGECDGWGERGLRRTYAGEERLDISLRLGVAQRRSVTNCFGGCVTRKGVQSDVPVAHDAASSGRRFLSCAGDGADLVHEMKAQVRVALYGIAVARRQ